MRKRIILLIVMISLMITISIASAAKVYSVDINNVDKKQAIDYIANEMIGNGFNIISANEYMLVCRRDVDNIWAKVFYGSKFNSTPEIRMYLNFAQINNVLKVTAEARVVTNPNSAFENSQVIENKDTQLMLNRFKDSIEQKDNTHQSGNISNNNPPFGFVYADALIGGYIFVSKVIPSSDADKVGLKFGDRITKVNSKAITTINNFNSMINSLSTIDLAVKTDDQPERIITISKTK